MKPKIGIRLINDARMNGVREKLEEQVLRMALSAKKLIEDNVFYSDGTKADVIISSISIAGGAEAAKVEEEFSRQNVCATLSVTPSWCYGSETMDLNPLTVKAVWGFNSTECPGAVYLAAVMAAHAQRGLPAFAVYGCDVMDKTTDGLSSDVKEKIIKFAKCALAVGQMKNKAYVNIGSVSMGIAGSFCDPAFFQKYLGIRAEWVDMSEISKRVEQNIFDKAEFERALEWVKKNCPEGDENNANPYSKEEKEKQWEFCVKMTLIIRDIMLGNEKLKEMGFSEESLGRNAALGGFQGQRMWTDYRPNADFSEAILNSSFDWNGIKEPIILATENDTLNGVSMLMGKLLTGSASVFADVRTYWSPKAIKEVSNWTAEGKASGGFIHLINSGAAALDGTGRSLESGTPLMKQWWKVTGKDTEEMLKATKWAPAARKYFRGGGFSSQFNTKGEMPVTLVRVNLIDGLGPVLQIAEGWTVDLPEKVNKILLDRTDPTWPSTWFVPRLANTPAFKDVYSVMASWGANHGAFAYSHIGAELITLASMLRIPVSMHNIDDGKIFRPHAFSAFGTKDLESADYRACAVYGPLYK